MLAGRRSLFIAVMGGGRQTYQQRLSNIIGADLYRHYPLSEAAGAVAYDKSANAGNGAYSTGTTPVLAQAGWGDGLTGINFRASSYLNLYSAGFVGAINAAEFTVGVAFKPPYAAYWTDGVTRDLFALYINNSNYISFVKHPTTGSLIAYYVAGGTTKSITYIPYAFASTYNGWLHYCITVSKANDRFILYVNGQQREATATGLGTWSGTLPNYGCTVGNWRVDSTGLAALGTMAHWFYANRELSAAEVGQLSSPTTRNPGTVYILPIGDSKATAVTGDKAWRMNLATCISGNHPNTRIVESTAIAVSGITTAQMQDRCDADITAMSAVPAPNWIIYNLGANDATNAINDANWIADTNYILDAYHTAYPNARVLITKVWRRDAGDGVIAGRIAQMNTNIDDSVLPTRTAWLSVGDNEADYLPGADDGATNTVDGIHLSAAGSALKTAVLMAAMGY